MAKILAYAVTDVPAGGTLNVNVLHDALLADPTYVAWKGTWNATKGYWENPPLAVQSDDTTIWLTVPDATDETALLTVVNAQRV